MAPKRKVPENPAKKSTATSKNKRKPATDRKAKKTAVIGDRRKILVERELIDKACVLFAEKGYAGTSLTDIADAVGLTRGAIYYYFKNKEALLEKIVKEVTLLPVQEIDAWRSTVTGPPVERLRSFVKMRILAVTSRSVQMRMIEITESILPPDLLRRHTEAKRQILAKYRELIKEGILTGEFRPVDDRMAALSIIGMVNWTCYWFVEGRGNTAEETAETLSDLAVHSILAPSSDGEKVANPKAVIATLRENLDHLSRIIDG